MAGARAAAVMEAGAGQPRLNVRPCTLRQANLLVRALHRHHGPVAGHRFSLAAVDEGGATRGVAILGRPVARALDDGLTLEIRRVATDGCANACSALYGASRRVARAMGYRRLITYILASESGVSLRAAGWARVAASEGGSWDRPSRRRVDRHPVGPKELWEAPLGGRR